MSKKREGKTVKNDPLWESRLTGTERERLRRYRKDHADKLKELYYECNNGTKPPKPWYED